MSNLQELLHIGLDEEPERFASARQRHVDELELPAVFAPRVERERAFAALAGGDGARLGLERRASAAPFACDDGRRARRRVEQMEAHDGDFARVQPPEPDGVGAPFGEGAVRDFDDAAAGSRIVGLFARRCAAAGECRQQCQRERRSEKWSEGHGVGRGIGG